jgi:Arm DNA-binding domain
MALSDTWLKSNNGKARAALEERGDREGLGVRITPKGKITFQLRYRYHGTPKRLDLGSYLPEQAKAYEAWAVGLAQITDKGQQQ